MSSINQELEKRVFLPTATPAPYQRRTSRVTWDSDQNSHRCWFCSAPKANFKSLVAETNIHRDQETREATGACRDSRGVSSARLQKIFFPCVTSLAFEAKNYNRKLGLGWCSLVNKYKNCVSTPKYFTRLPFPRRFTGGIILNEISKSFLHV